MSQSTADASSVARRTYDQVWSDVGKFFFDVGRLGEWESWRHRFDDEIVDMNSCNRCIDMMLESLGDPYTRRLSETEMVEEKESRTGRQVDTAVLDGDVGYLRISGFDADDITDQVEAGLLKLEACRSLIVDLRDNGGGVLNTAANCCELLIERAPLCTIKMRDGDGLRKHEVYLDEETYLLVVYRADGTQQVDPYCRRRCLRNKRPIVILIDGWTASAAEVVASALLGSARGDGSVIAVGEASHGKGIAQQHITYQNETVRIKVTSMRFYGPDDTWFGDCGHTEANGVKPHVEVSGADEQLQVAIGRARELTALAPV